MKKSHVVAIVLVLAALAGLLWLRRGSGGDQESGGPPEVAVRVGQITRTTLQAYVTAYGTVEPEPAGGHPAAGSRLGPLVAGVVAAVKCTEGQTVAKGAVLVRLESREAQAAVQKAQEAYEFAGKTAERQRSLIQVNGTSQRQLLEAEQALAAARGELETARAALAQLSVTAPISATVARIYVRPGEAVDLSTVLLELVDLDRLVISAGVPGAELDSLKVGQAAEVQPESGAEMVIGSLAWVGPSLDAANGTAPVRVALPAGSGLRPGMFARVRIICSRHEDCLAVPVASLVEDSEGRSVIALVQADSVVLTPVSAGLRDRDMVEIEAAGLKAGQTVVTEGAYGLPDGARVRLLQ